MQPPTLCERSEPLRFYMMRQSYLLTEMELPAVVESERGSNLVRASFADIHATRDCLSVSECNGDLARIVSACLCSIGTIRSDEAKPTEVGTRQMQTLLLKPGTAFWVDLPRLPTGAHMALGIALLFC